MRLSTKSRYAVSALLHLAIHNQAGAVPLAEVSVCQGISMSYVDQIFALLRQYGLVQGTPGPGGGYRLARPAPAIAVGEVIRAMEAAASPGRGRGGRGKSELEAAVWEQLERRIDGFLDRISLADLAHRPGIRKALLQQYDARVWRCEVCGVLSSRRAPGGSGGRAGAP